MKKQNILIRAAALAFLIFALLGCGEDSYSPPEDTVKKLVTEKIEGNPADYGGAGLVKSIGVTDFKIIAYGSAYTSYTYNYGDSTIYPVRVEITENQGWEQYGGEIENKSETKRYDYTFSQNSYGEWQSEQINVIGE